MYPPEPPPSRWELHGRLFGADLRIRPLFWISCALLGVVWYQYPEIRRQFGGMTAFGMWMAAVLVSMLAHELGHVLAARLLRAPLRIVLSGFGGQLFGLEEQRPWRNALIVLAGPLANGVVLVLLWAITAFPLPIQMGQRWREILGHAAWLILWINALWGLLNLLPVWPLDMGRIFVEVGNALFGRRGQILALLLSLGVCLALLGYAVLWMRVVLINRFDERYLVYFVYFCILVLYAYALWLSTFRALWGDADKLAS